MKKIFLTILVASLILISICYYKFIYLPEKVINSRCIGTKTYDDYNFWGTGMVDCYGVISIKDSWDELGYSIFDHKQNVELGHIYGLTQFLVYGDNFYFRNLKPHPSKYYIVNYKTGDKKEYNSIVDVPEEERKFFNNEKEVIICKQDSDCKQLDCTNLKPVWYCDTNGFSHCSDNICGCVRTCL